MSFNQKKIDDIFCCMSAKFGLNRAGRVHVSLLKGNITPDVRSVVRKLVSVQKKIAH